MSPPLPSLNSFTRAILLSGVLYSVISTTSSAPHSKAKSSLILEPSKIITFDAVKRAGQKNITKLLMALDRGNYIRQLDNYKKLLPHFDFFIAKNRYLRFPYDHLISTKNIDKNIISDVFK